MRDIPVDPEREARIDNEIIVDSYTEEEQTLGWYYYIEEHLHTPFRARCIAARNISPVRKGEEVTIIGMAEEEDCMGEIIVLIDWCGRTIGVPLIQLEGIDIDADTAQVIADWHYWVVQGHHW